jgi:8-oxo-dGTP diphosphatase
MRVFSVAYLAFGADMPDPVAGGDAAAARWTPVPEAKRLAFDHAAILADGLERARAKLEYTPLATAFCPPVFTIAELRAVYETVWRTKLDPRNFHRKVTGAPGFLVETGATTTRQGGRPAQLYRVGDATLLVPPLLRG